MIASAHDDTPFEPTPCLDRQVQAAATAALAASKYTAIRTLKCRVVDGVIEIIGRVPSFYLKQLAQAAVLPISPSGQVHNLVEVSEEALLVATHNNR